MVIVTTTSPSGTAPGIVWAVCLTVSTALGALAGAAVGLVAYASCTGDSLCSSDEGGAYGIGSFIVLTVAGLIAGIVLAVFVRARQRRTGA